LIPDFDPDNELDSSKKRKEWMRTRATSTNWDADVSEELIIRYGTVHSLEEAERKLEEVNAERLLEKAEENEKKQGKKHHLFSFIVLTLFVVFSCLLSSCIFTCC
jgi:hypothetical protein